VFLSAHKLSSDIEINARDASVLISLALQHGVTPRDLGAALTRADDGGPQGLAGRVLDLIDEMREQLP
jgi:hypothetical protein